MCHLYLNLHSYYDLNRIVNLNKVLVDFYCFGNKHYYLTKLLLNLKINFKLLFYIVNVYLIFVYYANPAHSPNVIKNTFHTLHSEIIK